MMKIKKKIFIGAAWPYANGSLHLGHVASLIGADVIARYHRLCQNEVLFVSGSDCHGTPIAVEADKQKVHPAVISEKYHKEFLDTLINGLNFSYDLYTNTTTEIHKKTVQEFFLKLYNDGFIYKKTDNLPYCLSCKRFLPDRYVEGGCPLCHFSDARGDQCDGCGSLLDAVNLVNPKCKICNSIPVWKPTEHFYLKLSLMQKKLKNWVNKSTGWKINAKNYTINVLNDELPDRAITRDTNWGIPIPIDGYDDKRIYVWFDAVCGYLSASKEYSFASSNENLWKEFWLNDDALHYYVHGKDNIPFHTIIWPAILIAFGDLHLPDRIISSEYLMLGKKQFSKSRQWAVWIPEYLKKFDSELLRYYLIANGPETSDANFDWVDFKNKVNGELIGTFGNFINRTLSLIKKNFPGGVSFQEKNLNSKEKELLKKIGDTFYLTGKLIGEGKLRLGLRGVFDLAEFGNHYLQETAPWFGIKKNLPEAEKNLALMLNLIKNLGVLVEPYLPNTAIKIKKGTKVDLENKDWNYINEVHGTVGEYNILFKKIEDENIKEENMKLV